MIKTDFLANFYIDFVTTLWEGHFEKTIFNAKNGERG
jgi:hypothetical protein